MKTLVSCIGGHQVAKSKRELAAIWADRVQRQDIGLADLVRLGHWRTLPDEPEHALGEEFYEIALTAFKTRERKRSQMLATDLSVSIFGPPGCGVSLNAEQALRDSIMERAIEFDWSAAQGMLGRVKILANQARDLWPADLSLLPEKPSSWVAHRRWKRKLKRIKRAVAAREPHSERAYELCTSLFSAVNLEKLNRNQQRDKQELTQDPSPAFLKRVAVIRPGVDNAEVEFDRAAQRYARGRYGKGMIFGVIAIALLCIALAIVFLVRDIAAWYGVALLAGGVGAAVSVLQRMASGQLRLDYDAGPGTLVALGAVRPLIGAVFGLVLFSAVEGGWLPAVQITTGNRLAFYAVLGFLAGFNERFAQDMLVSSAGQLGARGSSADSAADPLIPGASHSIPKREET